MKENVKKVLDSLNELGIGVSISHSDNGTDIMSVLADELSRAAEEASENLYRKRFRLSKLKRPVHFSDYQDNPDRKLDMDLLNELHSLRFMEERHNIIFWGNAGTGKTWLAESLATQACRAGKRVRAVDFQPLYRELEMLKNKSSQAFETRLNYYAKFELLFIDEFLNYSMEDGYILQELAKRIEDIGICTLIVSCQSEPSNWPKLFPVRSFGESIRGRILQGAKIIHTQGRDMRLS